MTNEKKCNLLESLKNASNEVKFAYVLIVLLIISNVYVFVKLCDNKNKEVVANWIRDNPKAIIDSVQRYAEREQAGAQRVQQEQAEANVKSNLKELRDETNTGVANPKGTKIIVEFFDYNCGYCKMASEAVDSVVKSDNNVKVIFREFPILGEASIIAARYSVAVSIAEPGKFYNFYKALINGNARSEDGVLEALKVADIQVDKVRKVLQNKANEIEKRLKDNERLANLIGVQGTPALIIGEEFIPGYIEAEAIRSKLR
jgi:protein-disulfide isomerase